MRWRSILVFVCMRVKARMRRATPGTQEEVSRHPNLGVHDNMIKKVFATAVLAAMTMSAQASVVINEGFDNVAGLAANGWVFTNAGTPGGTTTGWTQSGGIFDAQSGPSYSYASANYANSAAGGTLNSWLITPVFDASLGATVSFYLRADAVDGYTDQVNFGFINADGSFTSAGLSTVNPVPVSGWTQYTAWIGADALSSARFAFQYTGAADTANYVGLDTLTVDVPEPASIALMAGGLLGLGAMRRRVRR